MLFLEACVIFVWSPQVLECLYLICHLSLFVPTLRGRVWLGGDAHTVFRMAERVRGAGGGDLCLLCMDRGILCSLGAIRGLQEIVTGSLQPSGI